ncbi:acyl-CoA thioesterase [bacterium]|nr:acyl-CoA thioesterase [bacterium]
MSHLARIKVRGYHLDFYGHVNNARYLELLEEARWRMVEDSASLRDWHARGLAFVIVKVVINFRRPAVLDDELEIASRIAHLGGRSGVINQEVRRAADGERIADADITFVIVDINTQRAVPIEGEIREALRPADAEE